MKVKKIIIGLLVLGFLGAFFAYKIYNKPHLNVANEKADITIAANKILAEFSSNENTANTKYLDKIVQVEGVVSSAVLDNGIGIITLKTNDDFGSIMCYLTFEESKSMQQIKAGQEIILKGICTGFLMDVVLVKCIVIN